MNLITLDSETYFDADYTIKKMTTESYVRDSRFKVHCWAAKMNASEGVVPNHQMLSAHSSNAFLAHHGQFDGLILNHHYGIRPAFWFDTMAMAHLLFPHEPASLEHLAAKFGLTPKTVPYDLFKGVRDLPPDIYNQVAEGCLNDVELTYAIFQKMLPYVPAQELRLIDLTIRLFTEPALRLNRDVLQQYLITTEAEKAQLLASCGVTAKELGSADKFAALLSSLGVIPPTKISKKTGKTNYAFAKTDKGLDALLTHEDPRVCAIVQARLDTKSNMAQTRAQRMLDMDARGSMCVYLNYCGANTLRWSGGDLMNWQNFKRGSALREAIKAPPGYAVVVVDASQIEARMLNYIAGQDDMNEKFRRKEDIYSEVASEFYGELIDKTQPAKRGTGKQIILSCGFRAGAESIRETARRGTYGPSVLLTEGQSIAARDLYRNRHPNVVSFWKFCDNVILPALLSGNQEFTFCRETLRLKGQHIYDTFGASMDYSNLRLGEGKYGKPGFYRITREGKQHIHGGIVTQNVVELLARRVLATAALTVSERYKICMLTHDEMVYLAPTAEAPEAYAYGVEIMRIPPAWAPTLPLDAEGGYDVNYSK